jgi:predicted phosphoadenosine phosphosulfate sulfurtransferase
VNLAFSGGKDSLCLAGIVEELIQAGEIDPAMLTVQFIDEEAIFPCIEEMVKKWRLRFLAMGARFEWYALEVKHYSCLNSLQNDESFICWDSTKKDVWVRRPPKFAIRNHPAHRGPKETYQQFFERRNKGAIAITGVRIYESIQRKKNFAVKYTKTRLEPLYDWTDKDVWLYLKIRQIEIPMIYLYLYQSGRGVNRLRVSQFFSIDTVSSLVKMNEFYPGLMDRIQAREENAYLVALYWDSEMFGRTTRTRAQMEAKKDYRKLCHELLRNPGSRFDTKSKMKTYQTYRRQFLKWEFAFDDTLYKRFYEGLLAGDPKGRTIRAVINHAATIASKRK